MATIQIQGANLGTGLQRLLMADDIEPGSQPSYEICKEIYLYHPLGAKIAEKPIEIAQSQERNIEVQDAPGDAVKEEFIKVWRKMNCDRIIFNVMSQARVYGIASLALLTDGTNPDTPPDWDTLWKTRLSFNIYDPLNTAGSLMMDQNPLSMKFQHVTEIRVNGQTFHKSRTCVIMNENPMYIVWQASAYGFSGRSVYQRALFPLKSFINTMVTNDMVSKKAGVIVAKIQQAGSVVSEIMQRMLGTKRDIVKEAQVGNTISIGADGDAIESIDLKNLAEPFKLARHNIIEDIASAVPMPAKMLTEESFAEGFGEGAEDARAQERYVNRVRDQMDPLYEFMTKVVQRCAWTPEFFSNIQQRFPEEYGELDYYDAFYRWSNSFVALWPSLIEEPESERVKVDDVKLRALVAIVELLLPFLEGDDLAETIKWLCDNVNEMQLMFTSPLNLNYEAIAAAKALAKEEEAKQLEEAAKGGEGFGMRADSVSRSDKVNKAVALLRSAVAQLEDKRPRAA